MKVDGEEYGEEPNPVCSKFGTMEESRRTCIDFQNTEDGMYVFGMQVVPTGISGRRMDIRVEEWATLTFTRGTSYAGEKQIVSLPDWG